ncbi:nucleotide exchange factor GrpE [Microbacterium sp. gxy059]|uniref:nucleotide exchange factor GrpE n=1 Tax=Microbacterium sp. gxy059 TaxID=2957199 RepID=UPI003D997184
MTGAEADLAREVAELRSLFQRRLLDDRAKNQLIDQVQRDLAARRELDTGEAFAGLFREILLAVDRLRGEEASAALSASVADELIEILARRGLEPVADAGACDPDVHEVVEVVDAGAEPGQIVRVRRPGYTLGARLLRPAQVVVRAHEEGTA